METTAFDEGFDAAKYNDAENPYKKDSEEYNDWNEGYNSYRLNER